MFQKSIIKNLKKGILILIIKYFNNILIYQVNNFLKKVPLEKGLMTGFLEIPLFRLIKLNNSLYFQQFYIHGVTKIMHTESEVFPEHILQKCADRSILLSTGQSFLQFSFFSSYGIIEFF